MTPFIIGRFISLAAASAFALGMLVWLRRARVWLLGFPVLLWALHGALFYAVYLLYYLHPALVFRLQVFADWGSILLMHAFFLGTFISWDLATGFFSRDWLRRRHPPAPDAG